LQAERTTLDNRTILTVDGMPSARAFVLEARPSWASAFVRRALESDSRFTVSGVTRASPKATVQTGSEAAWPLPELDSVEVVIVGGADRLARADVDLLDRFMRLRGGSVVLLPDAAPSSDAERSLLSGVAVSEALLDRPVGLADSAVPLRIAASELLEAAKLPAGTKVVARMGGTARAVIWIADRGGGKLLLSGAMDAWRNRADPQVEFDRFWRSVVSGLALAARPALEATVVPAHAAPGERVTVTARVRRLERERFANALAISAKTASGTPIRMWPDASSGVFTGSFIVDETD